MTRRPDLVHRIAGSDPLARQSVDFQHGVANLVPRVIGVEEIRLVITHLRRIIARRARSGSQQRRVANRSRQVPRRRAIHQIDAARRQFKRQRFGRDGIADRNAPARLPDDGETGRRRRAMLPR